MNRFFFSQRRQHLVRVPIFLALGLVETTQFPFPHIITYIYGHPDFVGAHIAIIYPGIGWELNGPIPKIIIKS